MSTDPLIAGILDSWTSDAVAAVKAARDAGAAATPRMFPLSNEQIEKLVGRRVGHVFGCTVYTGDGAIHHVTIIDDVARCSEHGEQCRAIASVRVLYDTTHPASKES